MTLLMVFLVSSALAEYQYGFGNLSVNYLDWDSGTQAKSTKKDFTYIEIEGGAQHSWGELYGFFDFENIGQSSDSVRTASKGSISFYLPNTKFGLYAHQYSFQSLGFSEQNRVIGFSYVLSGEGWWFKPFLGFHDVIQTFYTGPNGYMGGWVFGYNFTAFSYAFTIIDWHEIEFERNQNYAAGNGDSKTGINGALSLWWSINSSISVGQQFRYATNKLGTGGDLGAWISTLKYNF